jgi:hypothetical protein
VTITNREVVDEFKQAQSQGGGQQIGGGSDPADQDAAGGSSGTGGYGNAQNQSFHQGQTNDPQKPVTRELSRGERFDLEQGGGRGVDSLDEEGDADPEQGERETRGQRFIDEQEPGAGS